MSRVRGLVIQRLAAEQQRGSVMIMTVGFMLLGVLCLALVIDTGRLYMEKRDLQRIADVAALEAASRDGCQLTERNNVEGKWRQEIAQESATRNNFDGTVVATCGDLTGGTVRGFSLNEADGIAVYVRTSKLVPASLIVGGLFKEDIQLSAVAVATRGGNPLASLTIRSQTLTVDTSDSQLLNGVLGGLLGTSLNVSAVGYNALLETNVKTLDFVDALATELNITAGDTDAVLSTQLTLGQFLSATIAVLGSVGGDVLSSGLSSITDTLAALNIFALTNNPTTFALSELVNIQTTTGQAAAIVDTNLFDLVQGTVQLVSDGSVANVNLPVNIFGLTNATVKVKVVEPAQLSAQGDPRSIDASLGANDPNAIFVRTSQIRSLISLDLAGLGGITNSLTSLLSGALSPITNFLTSNFSVTGLVNDLLQSVLGCGGFLQPACSEKSLTSVRLGSLQVGLNVGGAKAYVSDYSCNSNKSLTANADTSLTDVYLGTITNFFTANQNPTVSPAPLVELGYRKFKYSKCILLGLSCSGLQWKTAGGGWSSGEASAKFNQLASIRIVNNPSANGLSSNEKVFIDPPNIPTGLPSDSTDFQSLSNDDPVGEISNLFNTNISTYSSVDGVLGSVLNAGVINSLLGSIGGVLSSLASTALDPLISMLLSGLGVNLASADLGANLTCESDKGVRLVN
ncbi:MAG: Flp pilus assembly protein TadG [Paraperlucidibaca sp.]